MGCQTWPRVGPVALPHPDLRVLTFGCLTSFVMGLCCGVVPAIRASGSAAVDGFLAGGQRIAGSSRGQRRIRHGFQALQIALTLVLLVGAGLLISSVLRLVDTPVGFDAEHLGYVSLNFPPQSFPLQTQKSAFADELVARVSAVPGVKGVALGQPPVTGGWTMERLTPEAGPANALVLSTTQFWVSNEYLRVAGIALKEGRAFGPEDHANTPDVVIISENAARLLWPGRNAIGERLQLGTQRTPYTVVGIVPHLKTIYLARDGVELFFPAAQFSVPPGLVVRMTGDVASVAASIRTEVRAIDPRVTVQRIGMVDRLFAESDPIGTPRFYAVLLGVLGALGLLTAAVGLYGLATYTVNQRRREIGVRLALGANMASIRRLMIRNVFGPVAEGTAAGLVVAMWLSKFLASQLFHVSPQDPATFATIIVLLIVVCGLAVIAPVRRAMRIDAAEALRAD
jgi:predicted permease